MKTLSEQTLASIALADHAYIPVLEKYNLDFCCRGKRSLAEACQEKNLILSQIIQEIENCNKITPAAMPFTEMSAGQLINYLIIHHHFYVKNSIPTILFHLDKILHKHGDRYPYMPRVAANFQKVADELLQHMKIEESMLFPLIREVSAHNAILNTNIHSELVQIANMIQKMESEHDEAGQLFFEIRSLTRQYTPPETACTTHRVCLDELRAFEKDLHQQIHLENNILFPRVFLKNNSSIVN